MELSSIKQVKKREDMTMIYIYRETSSATSKQIVNVLDLGYLGVGKDFPQQLSALPCKSKRNSSYLLRKKSVIKIILKKGL
jgi:hypothetical protein